MDLSKPTHRIFIVADVFIPIIVTDLLQRHNLLIDARKQGLVDENTNLSVCVASFSGCRLSSITVRHTSDPFYQQLLNKYSGIYQIQPKLPRLIGSVTHHITATGSLVFSKADWLLKS